MPSVGLPTFQQTFAACSFPEDVLAVLGTYPVEVRVLKAERAMLVRAIGPQIERDLIEQAQSILCRAFRLNRADITVDTPVVEAPSAVLSSPAAESNQTRDPDDLFAQMEAMRRQVMRQKAPEGSTKKSKVKQIYGKINTKKKPISKQLTTKESSKYLFQKKTSLKKHQKTPNVLLGVLKELFFAGFFGSFFAGFC